MAAMDGRWQICTGAHGKPAPNRGPLEMAAPLRAGNSTEATDRVEGTGAAMPGGMAGANQEPFAGLPQPPCDECGTETAELVEKQRGKWQVKGFYCWICDTTKG